MKKEINVNAPNGFEVELLDVFSDGSGIVFVLGKDGKSVCGNFVNGKASFHVPQNKNKTAKITKEQNATAREFMDSVLEKVGKVWMRKHNKMYNVKG